MAGSIDDDSPAEEVAPYLAAHLNEMGVYNWLVSVTKGEDSATQRPDGEAETSYGDTDSPGHDLVFGVRDVPLR